jgi:hypothetical protein
VVLISYIRSSYFDACGYPMKRRDRRKSPKQSEAVNNQLHAAPNNHSTGDQRRSITGDVHVSSSISADFTPAEKLARKAYEEKRAATDAVKRRIEYATLVVVILYTLFAGWQSLSISGQLKTARDANEAARDANDAITKNFRASQRAWIGPSSTEMPPLLVMKPVIWRVFYRNYGNSPAMKVRIRETNEMYISGQLNYIPEALKQITPPADNGKTMTIFNGETVLSAGVPMVVLSSKELDSAIKGYTLLIYRAQIDYQDIFGASHTTKVCQVWTPHGAGSCGFGEEAN